MPPLHLVSWSFFSAYNPKTDSLGFLALTIAITLALYAAFRRKADAVNFTGGAFLLCAALMIVSCWFTPGAGFLLTWPLVFALLPLGLGFASERPDSKSLKIARLLCAAPAVFLFTLVLGYSVIVLGGDLSQAMIVLVISTVVLLALLAPQLEALTTRSGLRLTDSG